MEKRTFGAGSSVFDRTQSIAIPYRERRPREPPPTPTAPLAATPEEPPSLKLSPSDARATPPTSDTTVRMAMAAAAANTLLKNVYPGGAGEGGPSPNGRPKVRSTPLSADPGAERSNSQPPMSPIIDNGSLYTVAPS